MKKFRINFPIEFVQQDQSIVQGDASVLIEALNEIHAIVLWGQMTFSTVNPPAIPRHVLEVS